MELERIKKLYDDLKTGWSTVYETLINNPSLTEGNLPGVEADDIAGMINTLDSWLNRVRAPAGHSAHFRLVSSALGAQLAKLNKTNQNLIQAQYGHLPAFVSQISEVYGLLHTMVVLSNSEALSTAADLTGELSTAHATLLAANRDLQDTISLSKEAAELKTTVETFSTETETIAGAAKETLQEIQELSSKASTDCTTLIDTTTATCKEKLTKLTETCTTFEGAAKASLDNLKVKETSYEKTYQELAALLKENSLLQAGLVTQRQASQEIKEELERLTSVVKGLLPDAASAGLAHSFNTRAGDIGKEKAFWLKAFSAGLILIVIASTLLHVFLPPLDFNEPKVLLSGVLLRLPFIGPLVWFAWYSALQFGNRVRVEEDYSFKKVTAEAFIGYRDHMKHLADVGGVEEGSSALTKLASKTVDVLSNEPLRIYNDVGEEAAPVTKMFGFINRIYGGGKE